MGPDPSMISASQALYEASDCELLGSKLRPSLGESSTLSVLGVYVHPETWMGGAGGVSCPPSPGQVRLQDSLLRKGREYYSSCWGDGSVSEVFAV